MASIGFESVANEYANTARILRGGLVYAYAGVRTLASWKPARFTVTLDGDDRIEFEGYSVSVANSRAFGGGFFIAPHAELDDGGRPRERLAHPAGLRGREGALRGQTVNLEF